MIKSKLFRVHVIDGEQPGPRLLITAGVHGDEFEPVAAVDRLTRLISPNRLHGTITLVPVVNEAAFNRAARCGEDGKDLARSCPGDVEGTLTERVAAELSTLIRSATHYIDLHTGGIALAILPLSGYTLHPDSEVLSVQRQMAKAFGLPIIWGTTPTLNGRTLSVARDANVPAIYVEHGGGVVFDSSSADQMAQGCMKVANYLRMLSGEAESSQQQAVVVEDDRPGSGHLQSQNAASIDGLFESIVRLGDRVNAGDVLGTVRSPITGVDEQVRAANSGIVIMLRLVASVRAGDALAAIIDSKESR